MGEAALACAGHRQPGHTARVIALATVSLACAVLLAPAAQAASGVFDRAWGRDVITGGSTDFEICTAAADCKQGEIGSLGGHFLAPSGVATDAAGNVYVADTGRHRVQKFDSSGNFILAWGKNVSTAGGSDFEICTDQSSCQAGAIGALGGELNVPGGVAVSGSKVWVADTQNNRVQRYSTSGAFEAAYGKDVNAAGGSGFAEECTVPAQCQAGGTTTGQGGEFDSPAGLAATSTGVYVSDADNNRVQRLFASNGAFNLTWGADVDGAGGPGGYEICSVAADCAAGGTTTDVGGAFDSPNGIAADAAGDVYVADGGNRRVQKFNATGSFLRAWGKDVTTGGPTGAEACTVSADCKDGLLGDLGGELNAPTGVAADPAGDVYVSDGNIRIQRFDSAGAFEAAFGKDVDTSQAGTGLETCTVAASCQSGTGGTLGGEMSGPTHLATDPAGLLYVSDTSNRRIQRFTDPPPPPPPAATPTTPTTPTKKCKKGRKLKKGKCVKKKRKKKRR